MVRIEGFVLLVGVRTALSRRSSLERAEAAAMKLWGKCVLSSKSRIVVLVPLLVALVSCSSGSSGSGLAAPDFQPDRASWRLPLDDYLPANQALQRAHSLAYSACMQDHGIVVPARRPSDYTPKNFNSAGRKLFNLAFVEKYGYHNGPIKVKTLDEDEPLVGTALDQGRSCLAEASTLIGDDQDRTQFVDSLAWTAGDKAEAEPAVKAAAAAWRKCMLPLGVPDLPPWPIDMPTPSQRELYGMPITPPETEGPLPAPPAAGTPAEIKAAVFDAKCRESSSFAPTFYKANVDAQLAAIAENRTKLEKVLQQTQESKQLIADLLARHGGE